MNEKNIVRKNNDICNRLFPIAFAILLLVALVVGVIEKNNPNEYTYVKKYESLDKYSVVLIDKEIGNSQEVNLYSYGIAEDCNRISVDTPEKLRNTMKIIATIHQWKKYTLLCQVLIKN